MEKIINGWRKVKSKWCEVCEIMPAVEVHHILARVEGGQNNEENLADLCHFCHKYCPNHHGFELYKSHLGKLGLMYLHGITEAYHDLGKNVDTKTWNRLIRKYKKDMREIWEYQKKDRKI